jgi:hypothetical protein
MVTNSTPAAAITHHLSTGWLIFPHNAKATTVTMIAAIAPNTEAIGSSVDPRLSSKAVIPLTRGIRATPPTKEIIATA